MKKTKQKSRKVEGTTSHSSFLNGIRENENNGSVILPGDLIRCFGFEEKSFNDCSSAAAASEAEYT